MTKDMFVSEFERLVHEYYTIYKNGTKGWGN